MDIMSTNRRIVIMRGLPGAGKTTYVKDHYPDAAVVSASDFFTGDRDSDDETVRADLQRSHHLARTLFFNLLEKGECCIVIDNTNIDPANVRTYATPAMNHGYDVEVITLLVRPEIALTRTDHDISPSRMDDMSRRLEIGNRQLFDLNHKKISPDPV